jgi:hypothetical protein
MKNLPSMFESLVSRLSVPLIAFSLTFAPMFAVVHAAEVRQLVLSGFDRHWPQVVAIEFQQVECEEYGLGLNPAAVTQQVEDRKHSSLQWFETCP